MKNKRAEREYSQEDLIKAMDVVNDGKTLGQAAHEFGLPKTTLY